MKRNLLSRGLIAGMVSASFAAASVAPGVFVQAAITSTETQLQGDARQGEKLYQACTGCHSIDEDDIGPRHRGVVGRRAGSVESYAYSAALKQSGIVWDEMQLDHWLSNPSALVPGTKMFFKIDDAQIRADIIAYLKEQK
jgi:cytochrome c